MRVFGLDLSDSIIRLVVIDRARRAFRMPIRGEIPVPDGVISDGDILKPNDVTALLKQLLTAAKPKSRRAIVTLPERHSFIKVVELPTGTPATSDSVKEAVLPHVPYQWDEMTFDWRLLPSIGGHKEARVLFGGAPTTTVRSYLDTLGAAGIEVVSMEIESVAIARAMLPPASTGAHILLDLGRTRTSLILVSDGVVEFSSTLRYAGKDLNRYLADALRITPDQAQRAKELFGLDPAKGKGLLARVLAPQLDVLAERIRNIQDYYVDHFEGEAPITSIMLNGSGALIRNFDVELSKRLDETVTVQPSWIVQQLSDNPTDVHDIAFTYTTALGLALQPYFSVS